MPARTPPKPARREPVKVAAIAILALMLIAILFWPADDSSDTASAEPARRQLDTDSITEGKASAPGDIAEGGASAHCAKLPRLDGESIAAADPFVAKGLANSVSDGFADPQIDSDRILTSAPAEIRAVYRTARGAVAIVDNQIIPVQDPKKWIESMRSTDADP